MFNTVRKLFIIFANLTKKVLFQSRKPSYCQLKGEPSETKPGAVQMILCKNLLIEVIESTFVNSLQAFDDEENG